jgi:hypothetical protein
MLARFVRVLTVAAAVLVVPAAVRAQDSAIRLEIRSVGDSVFTFNSSPVSWIARGQQGIVVDPRRRDVLVARFRVLSVDAGVGNALILGQTQPVSIDHVALLREPRPRWFSNKTFWFGVAAGAAGGFVIGKAF